MEVTKLAKSLAEIESVLPDRFSKKAFKITYVITVPMIVDVK